jgi:hypothetical protein
VIGKYWFGASLYMFFPTSIASILEVWPLLFKHVSDQCDAKRLKRSVAERLGPDENLVEFLIDVFRVFEWKDENMPICGNLLWHALSAAKTEEARFRLCGAVLEVKEKAKRRVVEELAKERKEKYRLERNLASRCEELEKVRAELRVKAIDRMYEKLRVINIERTHKRFDCRMCMQEHTEIYAPACGHANVCRACWAQVSNCPICGARFDGTLLRIYLS